MVLRIESIGSFPDFRSPATLGSAKYCRFIRETASPDRKFWIAQARRKVATALSEESKGYLKTLLAVDSWFRTVSLSNYNRCQLSCNSDFLELSSIPTFHPLAGTSNYGQPYHECPPIVCETHRHWNDWSVPLCGVWERVIITRIRVSAAIPWRAHSSAVGLIPGLWCEIANFSSLLQTPPFADWSGAGPCYSSFRES